MDKYKELREMIDCMSWYDEDYVAFDVGTISSLLAERDALEAKVSEWISVKDALPEDGEHVAFIADIHEGSIHKHIHGKAFGGAYRGGEFPAFSYPGHSLAASYWIRLPPLPEAAKRQEGV